MCLEGHKRVVTLLTYFIYLSVLKIREVSGKYYALVIKIYIVKSEGNLSLHKYVDLN